MKLHPILIAALPALVAALPCSASLLLHDSFSGATGATPADWTTLGTGSNNDYVSGGSLSIAGLAESSGGKWTHDNSTAQLYRRDFRDTPLATGETVYYSFILQVTDITGLKEASASSTDYALLGLSTNGATTINGLSSSTVGIRKDPEDSTLFKLVFGNALKIDSVANVYEESFALGEQILIVASFTRGTTTSNGTANFWVNPDASTFGDGTVPTPSVSMTSNNAAIQSLLIATAGAGQGSNYPASWSMDERRGGTTWADVTPAIPEPSGVALLGGLGALACATLRRRR